MNARTLALIVAAVLGLSAQTPSLPPSAAPAMSSPVSRHLEYRFGFNTKVAKSGTGTGTTTIDISGPAKDGGLVISAADFWWNTVRPRATNTCELYPNGSVSCLQRPYAISPIQVVIFPLLGHSFFKGLSAGSKSSWKQTFQVKGTILPGASAGFAGNLNTWNNVYSLQGHGVVPNDPGVMLILATSTIDEQGGRYYKGTGKVRIAYDVAAKIPVIVSDVRTHIPMTSVYSKDLVELQLIKDSMGK